MNCQKKRLYIDLSFLRSSTIVRMQCLILSCIVRISKTSSDQVFLQREGTVLGASARDSSQGKLRMPSSLWTALSQACLWSHKQQITIRSTQYPIHLTQCIVFESINHWAAVQFMRYAIRWHQHVIPDMQVHESMFHWNGDYHDSLVTNLSPTRSGSCPSLAFQVEKQLQDRPQS